jgi:hypothetical protein
MDRRELLKGAAAASLVARVGCGLQASLSPPSRYNVQGILQVGSSAEAVESELSDAHLLLAADVEELLAA